MLAHYTELSLGAHRLAILFSLWGSSLEESRRPASGPASTHHQLACDQIPINFFICNRSALPCHPPVRPIKGRVKQLLQREETRIIPYWYVEPLEMRFLDCDAALWAWGPGGAGPPTLQLELGALNLTCISATKQLCERLIAPLWAPAC